MEPNGSSNLTPGQENCFYICERMEAHVNRDPLYGAALILLSLSTIVLNFLVILAITLTPQLRTTSNMVVTFLAVSDFSLGFFVLPAFTIQSLGYTMNCVVGMAIMAISSSLLTMTVFGMILVATDRYFAIFHPFRYIQYSTTKNLGLVSVAAILLSLLLGSFWLFDASLIMTVQRWISVALVLIMLTWSIYVHTASFMLSRKIRLREVTSFNISKQQRRNRKINSMMAIIFCSMLICYAPYLMYLLVLTEQLATKQASNGLMSAMGYILYANSAINPLIYCWKVEEIRRRVYMIMRRLKLRRRRHASWRCTTVATTTT